MESIERAKPKDLDTDSIDNLRFFYGTFEDGMTVERLLKSLVKLHFNYLEWYVKRIWDTSSNLDVYLHPPLNPRTLRRSKEELKQLRYGTIFQVWDEVRQMPVILAISPKDWISIDIVVIRLYRYCGLGDPLLFDELGSQEPNFVLIP